MGIEVVNPTMLQVAWIAHKKEFPKDCLSFIVKGTFELVQNELAKQIDSMPVTGDEFDLFNPNKGLIYESDFAYFKENADLLLKANCHTPQQQPMTQCNVTFSVAGQSRTLTVIGDRYAMPSMMGESYSDPEPFTTMPINFEHSYGGVGFEKNTVGKGINSNESGVKWMHNVFDSSLGEKEPASFGPINRAWAQRSKKLGTYDEKWQKERWPWFPEDFEWAYFNAAHESMQFDGYLNGDESMAFENLHPEYEYFECRLPNILPRCFAVEPDGDEDFREIELKLDTVYVDMTVQQVQLVWRGIAQVKSQTFTELSHVYVQQESLEGPNASKDDHQAAFNVLITPSTEFDMEPEVEEQDQSAVQEAPDDSIKADPFENAIEQSKIQLLAAGFSAVSIDGIFSSANPAEKISAEIQAMGYSSAEADELMAKSKENTKQTLIDQGLSSAHIDILFPSGS
ncbi:DUF2169 family type VI secretion system accessory protein [Marinicellulosiphila megalodicopiae]|uniref:DUF2169 family type VI secretion system accessory protein n=1 Tax=Marinicellulosiphila megalodicopiae TaxID=2724896 RepID=UPI003BAF6AE2